MKSYSIDRGGESYFVKVSEFQPLPNGKYSAQWTRYTFIVYIRGWLAPIFGVAAMRMITGGKATTEAEVRRRAAAIISRGW